jgi:hypothetical protein
LGQLHRGSRIRKVGPTNSSPTSISRQPLRCSQHNAEPSATGARQAIDCWTCGNYELRRRRLGPTCITRGHRAA